MWCIKSCYGYLWKFTIDGLPCSSSETAKRLVYSSRKNAMLDRDKARECGFGYKLVRLVTKREKLKRSITLEAERFDKMGSERGSPEYLYYHGYARALRDIASQL